jgi:hypothetical protein
VGLSKIARIRTILPQITKLGIATEDDAGIDTLTDQLHAEGGDDGDAVTWGPHHRLGSTPGPSLGTNGLAAQRERRTGRSALGAQPGPGRSKAHRIGDMEADGWM